MPLIEWRSEFELGIASVDHEHRDLIELINELHAQLEADATPQLVSAFLGEIYARISAHFALEETVMRDMRYDRFVPHKADHDSLLEEIRDIMDAYESGAFVDYGSVLSDQLSAWFTRHFKNEDARLHHALEGRGAGSA
ncbi:MAG: bacteriohemerythrin [Alphaproteobacteria bacterium]